MPVSGRPTNAALLKITHEASGPETNWRQKVRNDAGGIDSLRFVAWAALRAIKRVTLAANEIARAKDRAQTATPQRCVFLFGMRRSNRFGNLTGAGKGTGAGSSRSWKLRV